MKHYLLLILSIFSPSWLCMVLSSSLKASSDATTDGVEVDAIASTNKQNPLLRRSLVEASEQTCSMTLQQTATYEEVRDEMRQKVLQGCLNVWHENYLKGSYDFAYAITAWVRRVLGATPDEFPLKFAYYIHSKETTQECSGINIPKSFSTNGSESLCDFIQSLSSLDDSSLRDFMIELLDYGQYTLNSNGQVSSIDRYRYGSSTKSNNTSNIWYPDILELAAGLGFKQFMKQFGFLEANTDYYSHELYGYIEGGGGDGGGFQISCLDQETNHETLLLSGGGGGGGGMTSPRKHIPPSAGAGGGGGLQYGANAHPGIGAGMGNNPYGKVGFSNDINLGQSAEFSLKMRHAIREMRLCQHTPHHTLSLKGGGGGGGGLTITTYLFADDDDGSGEYNEYIINDHERKNRTLPLSVGYGFQFASGVDIVLEKHSETKEEDNYAICPPDIPCFGDTEEIDESGSSSSSGDTKNVNGTLTSLLFKCSSAYASSLCDVLTYTTSENGSGDATTQTYGKYDNYAACSCPLSQLYLQKYVQDPTAPMWNHLLNGDCTNSDSSSSPTIPVVDWEAALQDTNGDVCKAAQINVTGCDSMPFPGCESYRDDASTSKELAA